jgi:hypothetical protein
MPDEPGRGPFTDADALAGRLALGRVAFAAAIMAAPVASVRVLGSDTATAGRVVWLTRMVAARDGAIGVGALAAGRSGSAAPWVLAGALCDAVDAAVLTTAMRQGRVTGLVARLVAPGAAAAAVLGVVAAVRSRRR